MGRGSLPVTRSSTNPSVSTPPSSSTSSLPLFDDEENFILSALVALQEEFIANTASSGPAVDAKNKAWNLIVDRLCNKVGAVHRTDDQVRARWRSMRSAYTFKVEKPRHIAEVFYKRIQGTSHRVRTSDITVNGIKLPQWLSNIIKCDPLLKAKPQEPQSSSKKVNSKRVSPVEKDSTAAPDRKRLKLSRPSDATIPTLISQYPPSELSSTRRKSFAAPAAPPVKQERVKSPTTENSISPSSTVAQEEYNSVTESGTNSPRPSSVFWEETEYESRRRREDELHLAKLALLRSQKQEADAKTQLTKLQIEALIRSSTSTPPPSAADFVSGSTNNTELPLQTTSIEPASSESPQLETTTNNPLQA